MTFIAGAAWVAMGVALLGAAACAPDPEGWTLEPQESGSADYFGHLEHEKIMEEIVLMRREIGALRNELADLKTAGDGAASDGDANCGVIDPLDAARLYDGTAAATMTAYLTGTPPGLSAEGWLSPSIWDGLDLGGFWR